MRDYDRGAFFRVTCDKWDIRSFNHQWPGSILRGASSAAFEFDRRGNLVDVTVNGGDSSRWDGPELVALSEDAQAYGEARARARR